MTKYHAKLKSIRTQKGLSMKEVAVSASTSQQQIDRLEKGQRRLTLEWMIRLSKALDCEFIDLIPESAYHGKNTTTTRAKVIGKILSENEIEWLEQKDIYHLTFSRPVQIKYPRLFALFVGKEKLGDFPHGTELIFSELESFEKNKITDQKTIICSCEIAKKSIHCVKKKSALCSVELASKNRKIKAVLVKSIRNE